MPILSALLLLCASFMLPAEGDYLVTIQVHSYANQNYRCAGENCGCYQFGRLCNCCDSNRLFMCSDSERCDNLFTYCLIPEGMIVDSATGNTSICDTASSVAETTVTNWNDMGINFARERVLGLRNPFTLPGISNAWMGAMLNVVVEDNDTMKANDLVDVFSIPLESTITLGQHSSPSIYHGVYGLASITLNFTVTCSDSFYGRLCDTHCPVSRNCEDCLPGFTGEFCHVDIDDCAGVSCGDGQCVDELGSFRCICDPGYTGQACELVDYCHANSQCVNGRCVNQLDSFECQCDVGYAGDLCDTVDHCSRGNNCPAASLCVNTPSGFLCQCEAGFTGSSCEVNIDDCLAVECPENSNCVDGIGSFSCVCDEESEGVNCTRTGSEDVGSSNPGAIVGGVIGGVTVLILAVVIASLILAITYASHRLKRKTHISGRTVLGAGDNPIYALSSDVIPISVPPPACSSQDRKEGQYVNVYKPQQKFEESLDANDLAPEDTNHNGLKKELYSQDARSHHGYENVKRATITPPPPLPQREQSNTRDYQNVQS